jgi:acyl-CoA synthetase (AMP-forming)/AMP-acid ligase II/acyl carrier protein
MAEQPIDPAAASTTLIDLLRWRATHQPEQPAYIFLVDGDTEELCDTYLDLDQQARGLAAHLQAMGAGGERALLLYPPGLEFLRAFFACLYAGVIAVPLYPPRLNRPDHRIHGIAADAGAKLALTNSPTTDNLTRRLEHNPELDHLTWLATDVDFSQLAPAWRKPPAGRESLAYLQYTSGSTSAPKGVMVSHGNLMYNLAYIKYAVKLTPAGRSITWLPHFHDMGLVDGLLTALYNGFPGYLMAPNAFLQQPIRWLKAISRYKISHSGGPNFAYDLCVSGTSPDQREGLDLRSWRSAYNGAEPVRWQTLENFAATFQPYGFQPEARYPVFGLAEATLMVSGGVFGQPPVYYQVSSSALSQHRVVAGGPDPADQQTLVSSGRAMLETEIIIVHPDTRRRCAPAEIGEIWLRGPLITQGYWQRPEETAESFGARLADSGEGPYFRTGDLGFLKDEHLFVTGRHKDLIIIRGRNHYPQDIELTVAQSHPALPENSGAAFSIDRAGEERLVVVQEVERTTVRSLEVESVAAAIRETVAQEHELQLYAVVFVRPGSVPKTSSGKIQRHACRADYLAETLKVVGQWTQPLPEHQPVREPTPPAGSPSAPEIRAWMVNQIALRLGLDPAEIEVSEPFANYGLDSMELISVAGFLEEWLGRKLSPNLMYDYPTIAEVAAHLAEE